MRSKVIDIWAFRYDTSGVDRIVRVVIMCFDMIKIHRSAYTWMLVQSSYIIREIVKAFQHLSVGFEVPEIDRVKTN